MTESTGAAAAAGTSFRVTTAFTLPGAAIDSSEIGRQLTEIVAYGTAVVSRPSA